MRIGIVDDSPTTTEAMRRLIRNSSRHTVAWVAVSGNVAVEMSSLDPPELILMDLVMPVLDGVQATRRIMEHAPVPILLVTSSLSTHARMVYDALAAGALDATQKPPIGLDGEGPGVRGFLAKIDSLEERLRGRRCARLGALDARAEDLICLGASTGGPGALAKVLGSLEPRRGSGVVVIQHLDTHFVPGFIEWLGQTSSLPVCAAVSGESPQAGIAHVAMGPDHLQLDAEGRYAYTAEPSSCPYRPSVDVFFESVAACWKGSATGVLLTGMGEDGARGLLAMREAGHGTLAQDRDTSIVYGMPKAAAEIGAAESVLPLSRIGPALSRAASPSRA